MEKAARQVGNQALGLREILVGTVEVRDPGRERGHPGTSRRPGRHPFLLPLLGAAVVGDRAGRRGFGQRKLPASGVESAGRAGQEEESRTASRRAQSLEEGLQRPGFAGEVLGPGSDDARAGAPENHPGTVRSHVQVRLGGRRELRGERERVVPREFSRGVPRDDPGKKAGEGACDGGPQEASRAHDPRGGRRHDPRPRCPDGRGTIRYSGLPMAIVSVTPRYSAMTPRENRMAPEKKQTAMIMEVQPATGISWRIRR